MADASSSSSAAAPPLDPEAIAAVAEAAPPEEMTLVVKWVTKDYTVRVVGDDTLGELKRRICEVTGVLPKRQKVLYPRFKLNECDDSTLLSAIPFKPGVKINMVGTPESELFVDQEDDPEILNDYEIGQDEVSAIKDKDVYKQKLKRRASQYEIKILNPCRKGKKLLVLDIDYTLFDHRSAAENPTELMRPYLHEFLSAAYSEYDIIIWSATSMKWVKTKMDQLGVLDNSNYKITALMDHLAMITVQSENQSAKKTFDCKPLGVIWAQFPEYYNETNTIMFDDLRRNFVMNPQNELEDLSKLDHDIWESFTEENAKRRRRR
uniref:protein-serine/threonine phosphatase n=1 Tax=Leersia perrieri TaxID=77586 RepID=A0A0D9V8G8_9ORYZ